MYKMMLMLCVYEKQSAFLEYLHIPSRSIFNNFQFTARRINVASRARNTPPQVTLGVTAKQIIFLRVTHVVFSVLLFREDN